MFLGQDNDFLCGSRWLEYDEILSFAITREQDSFLFFLDLG